MKCVYCGTKLKKSDRFCIGCGQPVQQKIKKSGAKKFLIAFLSIILLAGIGVGGFYIWNKVNPLGKLSKALEEGSISDVEAIYKDMSDKDKRVAESKIIEYVGEQKEKYIAEETGYEYETVKEKIEQVDKEILINNDDVTNVLNDVEIINNSRIAYKTAEKYLASGDMVNAIKQYRLVEEIDTYYQDAQDKLKACITDYKKDVMEQVEESKKAHRYNEAESALTYALTVIPDDEDFISEKKVIQTENSEYEVQNIIDEARKLVADGDYKMAMTRLKGASKRLNDSRVNELYEQYYSELLQKVISESDSLFSSSGWEAAYNNILQYKDVFGDDKEFKGKCDYYCEYKPVLLGNMEIFGGREINLGVLKDKLGNTFNYAFISFNPGFYGTDYTEWHLDRKYSKLSGVLAYSDDDTYMDGYVGVIKIYADDELIYTSPEINKKSEPYYFEVNINGAKFIKIQHDEVVDLIIDSLSVSK